MITTEMMESIRDLIDSELYNLSQGSLKRRCQETVDERIETLIGETTRRQLTAGRGNEAGGYKKISITLPRDLWERSQDYPGTLSRKLSVGLSLVLDILDERLNKQTEWPA